MERLSTKKIRDAFSTQYEGNPRIFRAPGRVNIIGEHTDYNQGFVLPFAIDRETVTAGTRRDDTIIRCNALDVDEQVEFDLMSSAVKRRGSWIDYVEGTIRCIHEDVGFSNGADLVFGSTVPIGAGLSSSAALEVSVGLAILSLNGVEVDRRKLAFAAQRAEHTFVGTRSGIMDQFASVFGTKHEALLLDCRSLDIAPINIAYDEAAFVVCDTKVKHSLASGEYNRRREECEEGVELLKTHLPEIGSLRDVDLSDLERIGGHMPDVIYRRCRHVVTENDRTVRAAKYFTDGELNRVGELMFDSHRSLRDDYEVSSPELDQMVETARGIDGVFGSRMTGGGFGGCTVTLIRKSAIEDFKRKISEKYFAAFDIRPEIYLFQAVDGASEIEG